MDFEFIQIVYFINFLSLSFQFQLKFSNWANCNKLPIHILTHELEGRQFFNSGF